MEQQNIETHGHQLKFHADNAIEKHLSVQLSLLSVRSAANGNLEESLESTPLEIKTLPQYARLRRDISLGSAQLHKKESKSSSISLFDMFPSNATFSGSFPPTIRDILDARVDDILDLCKKARLSDLLGFNSSQKEIIDLSNILHDQLVNVLGIDENSQKAVKDVMFLYVEWMEQCIEESEFIPFAFLMLRNTILASCHPAGHMECRLHIVKILKEMLLLLMKVRNDSASFQISWMEMLYLLIASSYRRGTKCLHIAWAYHDPHGDIFAKCLSSMDSSLNISLLLKKTRLIQYLTESLRNTTSCCILDFNGDEVDFFLLSYSFSLLKIIVVHPAWNLSMLRCHTEKMPPFVTPTIGNYSDMLRWIRNVDLEAKKYACDSDVGLVNEDILSPFLSLLEIYLSISHQDPKSFPVLKTGPIDNSKGVENWYLTNLIRQAVPSIINICSRDAQMMHDALSDLFKLADFVHIPMLLGDANDAVVCLFCACRDVLSDTSQGYIDLDRPRWSNGLVRLLDLFLDCTIKIQSKHLNDEWDQIVGLLFPILSNANIIEIVGREKIKKIILTYRGVLMSSRSFDQSYLTSFYAILSSSLHGVALVKDIEEESLKALSSETDKLITIGEIVLSMLNVLLTGVDYIEVYEGKIFDIFILLENICSSEKGCDVLLNNIDIPSLCAILKMKSSTLCFENEFAMRVISILVPSRFFLRLLGSNESKGVEVIKILLMSLMESKSQLYILEEVFNKKDIEIRATLRQMLEQKAVQYGIEGDEIKMMGSN